MPPRDADHPALWAAAPATTTTTTTIITTRGIPLDVDAVVGKAIAAGLQRAGDGDEHVGRPRVVSAQLADGTLAQEEGELAGHADVVADQTSRLAVRVVEMLSERAGAALGVV
jgi:hypothetical protein